MSSWALHGQPLWTFPTITASVPLSDSKAVSDSHLPPEFQLRKSHGLLDASTQVSLSPIHPPCFQLSLGSLPNLLLPRVPLSRRAVLPILQVSACVLPSPESPDSPRVLGLVLDRPQLIHMASQVCLPPNPFLSPPWPRTGLSHLGPHSSHILWLPASTQPFQFPLHLSLTCPPSAQNLSVVPRYLQNKVSAPHCGSQSPE